MNIKEDIDYKALMDAAERLIYGDKILMAAEGEAPVQHIKLANGKVYQLSVVCKYVENTEEPIN